MKVLVCTDGSMQSQKAIKEAAKIAGGCNADEVVIIHVYNKNIYSDLVYGGLSGPQMIKEIEELEKGKEKKIAVIFAEAKKNFEEKGIKATTLLKEGHPAETIAQVADEGDFDMVVIGSRGLGGLKKAFLGSISNAVVQQVDTKVLVVK